MAVSRNGTQGSAARSRVNAVNYLRVILKKDKDDKENRSNDELAQVPLRYRVTIP